MCAYVYVYVCVQLSNWSGEESGLRITGSEGNMPDDGGLINTRAQFPQVAANGFSIWG